MVILYDLIVLVLSLVLFPVYLFKGKFHPGFSMRLGFLPKEMRFNNPIWIHAVSVGEAMAVRLLAQELRKAYPGRQIAISTVTPTGNSIAKGIAREGDIVFYLPLDFSFIVRKVIRRMGPRLLIIAETEIWPNLISALSKEKIPVVTVNGRISDSSFKGYSLIKPLLKDILNKISLFCMQSESDADRLKLLGVPADRIKVTGNMKFDQLNACFANGIKEKIGLGPEDKLIVAGSTHSGEEEILLKIYKDLTASFPLAHLLIAPRHPQRAIDIARLVLSLGFSPAYISQAMGQLHSLKGKKVFILDTVGELVSFYACADIVFVGGSLVEKGGHNILEPASCGKPVIFGPHMFNFRDIAKMFLDSEAAVKADNAEELNSVIRSLLDDSAKSKQLSANARRVIADNQGATGRNLGLLKDFIV
jgi:3-deoxy-D-manno-octulosonic-acid transferase